MKLPIKILIVSDNPTGFTGYGNQTRGLAARLAKDPIFEVVFLGCQNHNSNETWLDLTDFNNMSISEYKRINCIRYLGSGFRPYPSDVLQEILDREKPDILFILLDSFMLYSNPWGWITNIQIAPTKFVMYFPSDGYPFPLHCEEVLKKADVRVAMSKFAQRQVIDQFGLDDTLYIPHAVDPNQFYPLNETMKQENINYWSKRLNYDFRNKFIIGAVARNQGRKMWDRTFRTLGEWNKKYSHDDWIFIAHCDFHDPANHLNIIEIIKRFKLEGKVIWDGTKVFKGFNTIEMNYLYNLFNLQFFMSSGEGFGIPFIESMACEIPNLIPAFTSPIELVGENKERGILIEVKDFMIGTWNVDRGLANVEDAVEKLEYCYNHREELKLMGKRGREEVLKYYSWDVVFPQFKQLFEEIVLK